MYKNNEILALIPARGGSKGIKIKNIKKLLGKPLITYTIESAIESKYIDRVVVTTDDKTIAEVSKKCGAEVPFIRPKELAQDDTPGIEPIIHGIKWLKENENYDPNYVLCLQPTSPLRDSEDIDKAIEHLIDGQAASLVSVCEVDQHPYWMKKIEDGILKPFLDINLNKKYFRRQELPEIYILNGAIYMSKTNSLLQNKSFYGENTLAYVMSKEKSIDIDDIFDFKLVEIILKERTKNEFIQTSN
jgi:N-acylneuraminate cytidylyltransferase/CMP-N,N'-diacetyllegionaminic acid synthase